MELFTSDYIIPVNKLYCILYTLNPKSYIQVHVPKDSVTRAWSMRDFGGGSKASRVVNGRCLGFILDFG